jgi:hypothetical protein
MPSPFTFVPMLCLAREKRSHIYVDAESARGGLKILYLLLQNRVRQADR